MKYLITGLGNPGSEYQLTRHNIGFLILDRFAKKMESDFSSNRLGQTAEVKFKGRTFTLLKPSTFMNLSGKAVNFWLQNKKIPLENLLVITDDIALPFGKLRLRSKGSSGGHNGLGNIQEVLGSPVWARLRFGVGGDFPKGKQIDYVLSNFPEEELSKLPDLMDRAGEGIINFATIGIEKTMNVLNT